ncbi:MAG: zinc ABC transporter, ATP-binding protein [uncultured bacterium]|jgi:manganese/zinc/iron transport system ATP- binding protein|nr:MAG: zinc ABC transporter, ATP-binding protein [uncultured bacterium]HLE76214.1 ABC transporter ATP-binding protein [Candidatus Babeliales bacterium]
MNQTIPALSVQNLTVSYRSFCALQSVSAVIPSGILLAIAGPNGGGKTTFIKSVLGLVTPDSGTTAVFNQSFESQRSRVAYIPQRLSVDWDFPATVFDVVLMGRYAHIGWLRWPSQEDKAKAYEALASVGLSSYADRHISELSGGQQQRVFVARALVQEADLLLLDEPFVGVDIKTEQIIMTILRDLQRQGKTIIVVHHDLQTLSDYFDWVLLLNVTKIALGPIETVCMPEYICAAYGDRNLVSLRPFDKLRANGERTERSVY